MISAPVGKKAECVRLPAQGCFEVSPKISPIRTHPAKRIIVVFVYLVERLKEPTKVR